MKAPSSGVRRPHGPGGATRLPRARYRGPAVRQGRRRRRGMGTVLALAALVVVGWWAVYHVNDAGDLTMMRTVGRLLDPPATVGLVAPAGGVVAVGHSGAARRPGAGADTSRPRTPVAAGPARLVMAAPAPRATRAPGPPRISARRVAPRTRPPLLRRLPTAKLLRNDYQIFETWNNCGPASLSMALSYFGIQASQAALGQDLRPYQNPQGDNDDKDVTMDELANEARRFGLLAYHRPSGTIQLLKRFIASGLPVIADTLLAKGGDIGHFRVVKGYDDTSQTVIQDDSMQGHNVRFSYADFNDMWKTYNDEYLVLAPKSDKRRVEAILGADLSVNHAWREAVAMDGAALVKNPADVTSRLNLSVALYYVGRYQQAVAAFEQVQSRLPARTLWYQIEPIEAYYKLGRYQKMIALTDAILTSGDRAFSELYILRGRIAQREGHIQAARAEFQRAVFYNTNMKEARDALAAVAH